MAGEGAFGAVFKGTVKATDAIRAVKRIPLPKAGPKRANMLEISSNQNPSWGRRRKSGFRNKIRFKKLVARTTQAHGLAQV